MHSYSIFNIGMAIEPEEGGKLAHLKGGLARKYLQSALQVRAKMRR